MRWKRFFARKRLRGLRRHYRQLRQRATTPSDLRPIDWQWLARHQQTFLNVVTDPWPSYQAVPHQPAFRAYWLAHFLRTLPRWQAQLARRYSSFYLALELYEPAVEFWHSRLAVAVAQRQQTYQDQVSIVAGATQAISLPAEYAALPGMEALTWHAYARQAVYSLADYEQAGPEVRSQPHELGITAQGEPGVWVHVGWMWVGQLIG